jgi:hypothetical protein
MKHLQSFDSFLKEATNNNVLKEASSNFPSLEDAINSLSPKDLKTLKDVSMKVYSLAKQKRFNLYVNLKFGNRIELVVQHFNDSHFGTPEHRFMQSLLPLQTKLGNVKLEITTGNYDGPWDELTTTIDQYFKLLNK